MKRKIVFGLMALILSSGLVAGCQFRQGSQVAVQDAQQKVIAYDGEEGKTAYDILKSKYQVETDQSSFGVMVKSINGLKSSDKEFWFYSVNDKQPDVAADKYVTKTSDKVKWEYKGM